MELVLLEITENFEKGLLRVSELTRWPGFDLLSQQAFQVELVGLPDRNGEPLAMDSIAFDLFDVLFGNDKGLMALDKVPFRQGL